MYKAKIFVETSLGLDNFSIGANSYNDLKIEINKLIKKGNSNGMPVYKIIYSYPSGKNFTERLR